MFAKKKNMKPLWKVKGFFKHHGECWTCKSFVLCFVVVLVVVVVEGGGEEGGGGEGERPIESSGPKFPAFSPSRG